MTGGKLPQAVIYSALALLVIGWWLILKPNSHTATGIYRIGVDDAPPLSEIQPDGSPGGLSVEILSDAARRRNISLRWVHTGLSAEESMSSGLVDLWPVVGVTAARRKAYHLTEPWFFNIFCLVERQETGNRTRGDITNKKVSFTGYSLATLIANKYLPDAHLVKKETRAAVLEAVCSGETAAAFEESSYVNTLMLNRPRACEGVPLKINLVKDAVASGALASIQSAAAVAEELRNEISKMAADGTMAASLDRWSSFSANETRSVLAMQAASQQRQVLMYWLLLAIIASVCLFWQGRKATSARKAAELASAVKSEFLANMSHEIRTPLNGVLGLLDIVLDGEITPAERKHLETAKQSGESLLAILNDILDLSTVEAGCLRIANSEFNLRRTLDGLMLLFSPKCQEKKLCLSLNYPESIPSSFHGDQNRIRQIVTNFIGNAVKFTDRGSIVISVQVSPAWSSEQLVRISVEDTGAGIPLDKQEKLFQKFTQLDASPSRRHGGTGLGLAISKELAERMGGSVGMSSTVNGSIFWVDLPLQAGVLHKLEPSVQPASLPSPGQPKPSVLRRILIAEDNSVNQYVLSRSLQKLGYEVDIAANGLEAVKRWENMHYDAILMDCQMPEMDGYEATKTIRQHETGKESIPIIAITAHAMAGDEERCKLAGMNGYLDKPLKIADLQRVLNQYVPNTSIS